MNAMASEDASMAGAFARWRLTERLDAASIIEVNSYSTGVTVVAGTQRGGVQNWALVNDAIGGGGPRYYHSKDGHYDWLLCATEELPPNVLLALRMEGAA